MAAGKYILLTLLIFKKRSLGDTIVVYKLLNGSEKVNNDLIFTPLKIELWDVK